MNKTQLEKNILASFKLAKNDIINLHNLVTELSETQTHLLDMLQDTRVKEQKLYSTIKSMQEKLNALQKSKEAKKTVRAARSKTKFVGSKNGNKVHDANCPFAKNIKPKSRIVFTSKVKALNEGYKACKCLTK